MKRVFSILLILCVFGTVVEARENFACVVADSADDLRVNGSFVMDGAFKGEGTLEICREGFCQAFTGVEFLRGMWTVDRMNLYLRDKNGTVAVGLVVEDYFKAGPGAVVDGQFYGILGNGTAQCERTTDELACSYCFNQVEPNEFCKVECGCSTPFCGAW